MTHRYSDSPNKPKISTWQLSNQLLSYFSLLEIENPTVFDPSSCAMSSRSSSRSYFSHVDSTLIQERTRRNGREIYFVFRPLKRELRQSNSVEQSLSSSSSPSRQSSLSRSHRVRLLRLEQMSRSVTCGIGKEGKGYRLGCQGKSNI